MVGDAGRTLGRKILVLGCPGAGKSTLAREIGAATGLPVFHLDRYYWRAGWRAPSDASWHGDIETIAAQSRWVMDGNYGTTLPARLAAADTAIYLDFPTLLCLVRVFRRIFGTRGQVRDDMAPGCPERFDPTFLIFVASYRRRHRPAHLAALSAFAGRRIILRRPTEVAEFVRGLSVEPASHPSRRRKPRGGKEDAVRGAPPARCDSRPDLR